MANRVSFDSASTAGKFRLAALILGGLFGLYLLLNATLTRIDAGHVGIRVRLAGSARGVQDIPVVTGWVLYNPLTEQIVSFPTSVQNVVWTKSASEGRTVDESITFSSQEGANVNADIGLSFHIDPDKAPHLYLRFRQPDMMILADGYVRNAVREAFNDAASRRSRTSGGGGARSGRSVAPARARRSRRDLDEGPRRRQGQRDHPAVHQQRRPAIPRGGTLGRQAADLSEQRKATDV